LDQKKALSIQALSMLLKEARSLMTGSPSSPSAYGLPKYTVWPAWIVAAGFVAGGAYEAAFGPSDAHRNIAAIILVAGAALIVAGWLAFTRTSPWVAVALVFIGAGGPGAMLVWVVVPPVAAVALIVLFVLGARRAGAAKRQVRRASEGHSPA
jgi:uncharacterized membrane protein